MAMASQLVGRSVARRIRAQFASSTQRSGHYPTPRTCSKQQEIISHPYSHFLEGMRIDPIFVRPLFPFPIRTYLRMREPDAAAAKKTPQKRAQATMMYLFALVIAMVGCTYAAVPLYRKFCQATGYGGTVQRSETVEEKIARHSETVNAMPTRQLVVQFNADIADGLPWKFTPTQRAVKVKPGQSTLAFFTAENLSSKPITGVSTYNVTPMKAGLYFNKVQCFCFEEQRLLPGEKIDMPVFFYIDPEFATDPKMNDVNNLILSYTFFKVEEDDEEKAIPQVKT